MQSPVAILQKQRQYRASSYSQGNPLSMSSSGTTPSSLSSSFIDHAFDHPTPTSFSQLQLLSSSVTSNDGSDYTHRVPKVEEQFCSGFNCCGLELDDLHHLLEHFEECHVLPGGGSTPANPSAAAAIAAATGGGSNKAGSSAASSSSGGAAGTSSHLSHSINGGDDNEGGSDMPDFDDFDAEHLASQQDNLSLQVSGVGGNGSSNLPITSSGVGPTLSAPPSPALSSYSDHHNTNSSSGANMYELKTKRRGGAGSNSSFPSFNNNNNNIPSSSQTAGGSSSSAISGSQSMQQQNNNNNSSAKARTSSRSPPSDYEDAHSMHSEDDLLFTRRHRQQSVDSLASVSTNASATSKKRNFNTALGAGSSNNNNASSNNNGGSTSPGLIPPGMQGHQPAKPSLTGLDFANIRGRTSSGFSTPDSSHPGTPASEHEGIEMPGVGCVPPSLLFPLRHSQNPYSSAEEDNMTTDEEEDDGSSEDDDENIRFQHQMLLQQQQQQNQQFVYNGPQSLNPQMLNGNNNNQNQQNMMMMNNGNNQSMNMQQMNNNNQQQQFNNFAMNGMNMTAGAMHMMGGGALPQHIQQGFNNNQNMNNNSFAHMLGTTPTAEPSMKKKKTAGGGSGGGAGSANKVKKNKNKYDGNADHAAAAMFSPLTLQGQGMNTGANIPMPTISASTSPTSQVAASAATLAAIQAAAAANAFPDASTPTGRVWIPNNAKPFKCPVPGCDKAYKQQNGLKYHRLHGHCNSNPNGTPGPGGAEMPEEDDGEKEEDKPFGCYVGPACGKKYKNMNGLRYHYQHSGAHGQIGLQMLTNGTHPPPAYPPGHKRAGLKNYGAEFSNNPSPTVVMNQSTAEAILAAISQTQGGQMQMPPQPPVPHGNSRPSTPATSNLAHQLQHSPMGQVQKA